MTERPTKGVRADMRRTLLKAMKGCVCGPLALLACASDPEATLTASPTSGTAPLEVRFDASGSRDPKGGALTARFDFDSDGIWDTEPSA